MTWFQMATDQSKLSCAYSAVRFACWIKQLSTLVWYAPKCELQVSILTDKWTLNLTSLKDNERQ